MIKAFSAVLLVCMIFAASAPAEYKQQTTPLLPQSVSKRFASDASKSAGWTFSKIGDSNTEMISNIYPLSCGSVVWGKWRFLRPTLKRYQRAQRPGSSACAKNDSFARISASSRSASPSFLYNSPIGDSSNDAFFWPEPLCNESETWFGCEVRLVRPRYVFITTGTNDFSWLVPLADTKKMYRTLVRLARATGSAPVLTTLSPVTLAINETPQQAIDRIGLTNNAIIDVGQEMGVPIVNNWKVVNGLPNNGLFDGLHFSYPPNNPTGTANFSQTALAQWGANNRNLLFLRALDKLDRLVAKKR